MPATKSFTVLSPTDSRPVVTLPFAIKEEIETAVDIASKAQKEWRGISLQERRMRIDSFITAIQDDKEAIVKGIVEQVGRPILYAAGEIAGMVERAIHMKELSIPCLADRRVEGKEGFRRYVRRDPVGVVFIVTAWNYPLLVTINSLVPAILAGNAVILKASPQTPFLCEVLERAFRKAHLPSGIFQYLHIDKEDIPATIALKGISSVQFTGSVEGGRAVRAASASRFIHVGLELGGNDPAYVREDADVPYAAAQIVDGAFFNSGQSCCAIERVYVHEKVFDAFVAECVRLAKVYVVGDPKDPATTLGPVISSAAAKRIRGHITEAVGKGARSLVDPVLFAAATAESNFISPHILIDVDHTMEVMKDETFGPVMGIMRVTSDQEAVTFMNQSEYALTASIWTRDTIEGERLGEDVECGTLFVNRCDYLDPALAWTGHKESGMGASLGEFGFDAFTLLKSFHIKEIQQ